MSISHRMDELSRISDRITVMRDGRYAGTVNASKTMLGNNHRMMVGRAINDESKTRTNTPPDAQAMPQVHNLFSTQVYGASFILRHGEILGILGLMGACARNWRRSSPLRTGRQAGES